MQYQDYVTLTYSCIIQTYYVEQLNKIIEAINYASDSYWGNPERFKFKASNRQLCYSNRVTTKPRKTSKRHVFIKNGTVTLYQKQYKKILTQLRNIIVNPK